MSVDPLAFLDHTTQDSESDNDPLSFLPEYSKSPLRKPARHAAQIAKGLLNRNPYIASYNLATTLVQEGAHKSRMRVTEQAQKDLQAIDEKLARGEKLSRHERNLYGRTKQWAQRENKKSPGIDTESLINRGVKAATGIDLEPEDLGEHISNIGASLTNPTKLIKNFKDVSRLFSKEGRAALSAERAVAKTKAGWDSLNRMAKGNPEKEGIINFAQQKGLTPRETTLLLQSEKKINTLGKASKKTKQFERDVAGLKEKLGSSYDELRQIGRAGGYLGSNQTLPLLDNLEKIRSEINLTHALGPESAAAEKVLSEAIKDIEMNGTTIEKLIATRQNLGQGINWNKVGVKGELKGRMKEAIAQTIEKANPAVGKQLREVDQAYKKYKKFKDVLDKKQAFTMINGVPVPSGSIVFWGALGSKMLLGGLNPLTAAKYIAVKEGISRLSTAMLTNPKLQGIRKQLMNAVLSGNEEKQRKIMVIAQKIIKKEDPQLYDELGLED